MNKKSQPRNSKLLRWLLASWSRWSRGIDRQVGDGAIAKHWQAARHGCEDERVILQPFVSQFLNVAIKVI